MSDVRQTADYDADLANVALSVWSNTCNAYCSEEDRVHAPECALASGLHARLSVRVIPPGVPDAV